MSSSVCAALCWFAWVLGCVPAGVSSQRAIGDDLRLGQVVAYFKLRWCDNHSHAVAAAARDSACGCTSSLGGACSAWVVAPSGRLAACMASAIV